MGDQREKPVGVCGVNLNEKKGYYSEYHKRNRKDNAIQNA